MIKKKNIFRHILLSFMFVALWALAGLNVLYSQNLSLQIEAIAGACNGGSNGAVVVSASGGVQPYTFSWNNGTGGPANFNLSQGAYTVVVVDSIGQIDSLAVEVPATDSLDVHLAITKALCAGRPDGTATAIVNPSIGSYSYSWNNAQQSTTPQVTGLFAGQHVCVTVTEPNSGCVGIACGVIGTHHQVKLKAIPDNPSCGSLPTGSATATASHGIPPYLFTWTATSGAQFTDLSDGSSTIANLIPSSYYVWVVDSLGCTDTTAVSLYPSCLPQANFGYEIVQCDPDSNLVHFQLIDSSFIADTCSIVSWNWHVVWSNGFADYNQQTPPQMTLPAMESGLVVLVVTSDAGCVDTIGKPFTLPDPISISFNVGADTMACLGTPITLLVMGSPSFNYTWSDTTALDLSGFPLVAIANPPSTHTYIVTAENMGCYSSDTVTILRPDPIIIDLASDTLITCLDSVTIHVILNSATPVTWTNGAGLVLQNGGNNITVPANDPMWYHVNASDIYGCSSSDSVLIWGIGVDINVEIPPPAALCVDSMIQIHSINNNPGDTLVYSWLSSSPSLSIIGANTANPMVKTTVPGAYVISLIVSNQFSCADTINVPITLLPYMNIDDSIDIDRCDGLLVTFTNNSIYDGTWDFGDDSTSTNNPVTHLYAVAGTYTITFTPNASCVQVYTNTIEVIDSLPVKADFGYELVACGDTATYQFYDHTIHTYGIQSHAWTFSPFGAPSSSSEPNPLVSFGQEGTVTVKLLVTDIHGCTDSITTELNVQLNFDSVQDQSFCLGDTVALNPGFHTDYTYQWSAIPNDPSLDATVGNPLVTPQATTIYYVTITHGDCIKLDTALVILNPAAALNLPDDLATCNGTPVSVTAEGNGAGNYIWSTHSNFIPVTNTGATVLLTPLPNGIYYVKFTNLLGCMATDSVAIDNNQVDMAYDPEKIICGVGTVQLEIENLDPLDTLSYNWQGNLPPVSNPMVSPTGTTGYVAVVSNQFGCLDTAFIQVLVSNIAVNANAVAEKDRICSGDSTILSVSISGSNNFVVNWFANQEIVGDQEQVTVGPAENTLYTVLVTDVPTGCTAADTLTVYSRACICGSEPYVFVPTAFTPNGDGRNDFLIARTTGATSIHFMVYSRWGEKMYDTTDVNHSGWDGTIRGTDASPDSYGWYLEVTCEGNYKKEFKGNVTLLR